MWRMFLSATLLLASFEGARAQTVSLVEAPLPTSCYRNDLSMELTGKVTVQQEGKNISLTQVASARHEFLERILEARDGLAEKSARIYQSAEATITIGADVAKRAFRPGHSLMVAQRIRDQLSTYCPQGLLT